MKFKSFLGSLASAIVLLLAAIVWRPGGGPTPTPTPTPVVTPSPSPEPTAAPSVTPEPTALPTPPPASPEPTPPLGYLCRLTPTDGSGRCTENPSDPDDYPRFMEEIMAAQDTAAENGFVKNGKTFPTDTAYLNEVVRLMRVAGYCAINGSEGGHTSSDEIWQKDSNARSEHYDLITASHEPWTKYSAICRPAKFD